MIVTFSLKEQYSRSFCGISILPCASVSHFDVLANMTRIFLDFDIGRASNFSQKAFQLPSE
jgi:hypothetical protein